MSPPFVRVPPADGDSEVRASATPTLAFGLLSIPARVLPAPRRPAPRDCERPTDRLELLAFVPRRQIDPALVRASHVLEPNKGGDRGYVLLVRALVRNRRAAVGRFHFRGGSEIVAICARRGELVMHRLCDPEARRGRRCTVRSSVELRPVEEELADKLIAQLSTPKLDLRSYVKPRAPNNVIDLVGALASMPLGRRRSRASGVANDSR